MAQSSQNTPVDVTVLAMFNAHRAFAEHENMLVNHRMTWLITIQSFLIATFGFSFQKYFEIAEKVVSGDRVAKMISYIMIFKFYLMSLAIVGIVTAYFTVKSISGALSAIDMVGENWDNNVRPLSQTCKILPNVIGHRGTTLFAGHRLANSIPVFFVLLWSIILILCLLIPPKEIVPALSNLLMSDASYLNMGVSS